MKFDSFYYLSDTVDHVSDLRRDGGNAGLLLSLGHPELESQFSNTLFVFTLGDGERNVLESSSDGSSGTLDGDFSGLEINIDFEILDLDIEKESYLQWG